MKNYKTNINIISPLRNHSPNIFGIVFVQQIGCLKIYRFILSILVRLFSDQMHYQKRQVMTNHYLSTIF